MIDMFRSFDEIIHESSEDSFFSSLDSFFDPCPRINQEHYSNHYLDEIKKIKVKDDIWIREAPFAIDPHLHNQINQGIEIHYPFLNIIYIYIIDHLRWHNLIVSILCYW